MLRILGSRSENCCLVRHNILQGAYYNQIWVRLVCSGSSPLYSVTMFHFSRMSGSFKNSAINLTASRHKRKRGRWEDGRGGGRVEPAVGGAGASVDCCPGACLAAGSLRDSPREVIRVCETSVGSTAASDPGWAASGDGRPGCPSHGDVAGTDSDATLWPGPPRAGCSVPRGSRSTPCCGPGLVAPAGPVRVTVTVRGLGFVPVTVLSQAGRAPVAQWHSLKFPAKALGE